MGWKGFVTLCIPLKVLLPDDVLLLNPFINLLVLPDLPLLFHPFFTLPRSLPFFLVFLLLVILLAFKAVAPLQQPRPSPHLKETVNPNGNEIRPLQRCRAEKYRSILPKCSFRGWSLGKTERECAGGD